MIEIHRIELRWARANGDMVGTVAVKPEGSETSYVLQFRELRLLDLVGGLGPDEGWQTVPMEGEARE